MSQSNVLSIESLTTALWEQLPNDAVDWLKVALHKISAGGESEITVNEIQLHCSAIARRKSGTALLVDLPSASQWQMDEAIRVLLLSRLLEASTTGTAKSLIEAAYHFGDEYEKIAIIKGLGLLDSEGELVDLAILTGRTNSLNLFAAIALNNSYPALNYDDRAFNQLVLKALFMDLDIAHMTGLQQRLTPKLTALCFDLVKERMAADRDPPHSIWLAINFSDLSAADQDVYLSFTIEQPQHRYYCLRSLSQNSCPESPESFWLQLERLRDIETDENIRAIIIAMINQLNSQNNRDITKKEAPYNAIL